MLLTQFQPKYVEKILTNEKGEQFRVVFLVAFVDGQIKAKIVSMERVGEGCTTQNSSFGDETSKVLRLPELKKSEHQEFSYTPFFSDQVSPFYPLFFFNSQPTRAPSF
ncbi:MAG TPA: hypothetical protein VJH55_03340 [Candidatus Paceibacterota bacterium]